MGESYEIMNANPSDCERRQMILKPAAGRMNRQQGKEYGERWKM